MTTVIDTSIFDVPTPAIAALFTAGSAKVVRWVDIYEQDGETLWRARAPVVSGSISVDFDRDERRNIDLELMDADDDLPHDPDGLWYDKIFKVYVGVLWQGREYVTCMGVFLADRITRPHFPKMISIQGRDLSKKLILDEFPETTTFAAGQAHEEVIRTIATNGGITNFNLTPTGSVTEIDFVIERGTPRWTAIRDMAAGCGCEVFFDNFGYLTLRDFTDPMTAPLTHVFQTGTDGNLVTFTKEVDDTRLKNHVIVYGSGSGNPLVFAEAENTEPSSPTRIAKIGRRTYKFPSQFVESNAEAQEVADHLLAVMALEQYDVSMDALMAPWLEAGDAVQFLDPNPQPGQPDRYLLTSFSLSLDLSPMSLHVKRIHLVQ